MTTPTIPDALNKPPIDISSRSKLLEIIQSEKDAIQAKLDDSNDKISKLATDLLNLQQIAAKTDKDLTTLWERVNKHGKTLQTLINKFDNVERFLYSHVHTPGNWQTGPAETKKPHPSTLRHARRTAAYHSDSGSDSAGTYVWSR